MFAGGAARSAGVARILADVLGTPVVVPDRPEIAAARAVGAAALARHLDQDPAAIELPVRTRHEPDPDATAVHDRLQPIFEAAFSANASICQALGS
jgi:sugar (pentulose or hexulose) kinase